MEDIKKVLANSAQSFTDAEKLTARTNISAIGGVKVTTSSGTSELIPDSDGKVTVDLTEATGAQADWDETNDAEPSYIRNKPSISTVRKVSSGPTYTDMSHLNITPATNSVSGNPGGTFEEFGFLAPPVQSAPAERQVLTMPAGSMSPSWDTDTGVFVALWDGASGTKTSFSAVYQAYQQGKAVLLKWKDGATAYDYAVLSKITSTYAVFTQLRANETANVPNNTHNAYTVLLKDDDSYTFQNVRLNVSAGANVSISDSQSSDTKEISVPSVVKYDAPMMVDDWSTTEKYSPYWTICGGHMQLRMHMLALTGDNTDSIETVCIKSANARPYFFNATFYPGDSSIAPYSVGQYVSDGSEYDSVRWDLTMGFSKGLVGYTANEKIVIDVWYAYKANPSLSNDWRHGRITLMKNHDARKIYGSCEYDSDV